MRPGTGLHPSRHGAGAAPQDEGKRRGSALTKIVMAGLAAFAKLRRAERTRGPGGALAETGPGHPRLRPKTWMPGTRPGMTLGVGWLYALSYRWRVQDAAVGPELVDSARNARASTSRRHCGRRHRRNCRPGERCGPPSPWSVRSARRNCLHCRRAAARPALADFSASSIVSVPTPSSSALSIAKLVHFTTVNHWKSSWRTTGPSGSLEMISGRIT